jgi:hypothetical protein
MTEPETTTDRPGAKASPSRRDRLIKAAFLVVALGIVAYAIILPHLTKPLAGWSDDLPAALQQARAEGRKLVVLMYDSPQNLTYTKLRVVVTKDGNREAMDAANILRVQARVKRGDPVAGRFSVGNFPTTLLLSPDGEVLTRWEGYIPEIEYRTRFLQGESQN